MPACPKPRPRCLEKADAKRQQVTHDRAVYAYVRQRDGTVCRHCQRPATDTHHIVPRSRGGRTESSNLVRLCRRCHALAQGHALSIHGDADINLTFTQWEDAHEAQEQSGQVG